MPYCHVSQTFKGPPDLNGAITFIVVSAMVALGTVVQGFVAIVLYAL
jgi:hypothetical protein